MSWDDSISRYLIEELGALSSFHRDKRNTVSIFDTFVRYNLTEIE